MFTVNSNVAAFSIANIYKNVNSRLDQVSQQISSGKRINSSADDAAGMAQANILKSQYSSYGVVRNNLTFGRSLTEAADGALISVQNSLSKMRDLAVQSANGALSAEERAALDVEFKEYQAQIDTSVESATMFGQNLVSSTAAAVNIQSGINSGDQTTVNAVASDAATLAVDAGSIDLTDATTSAAAIDAIDAAIQQVSSNQATFGSMINRFEVMDDNIANTMENLDAARSRIEDADIPTLTKDLNLLQTQQQLAGAMLSMANSYPQNYLSLLR